MHESRTPAPSWSDERLLTACLGGDEEAWGILVDRYKNLVFSITRKYGANPEEAADLFQAVWLDVYSDLPKLRRQDAFKPWLISLTTHKCYHWKQKRRQQERREPSHLGSDDFAETVGEAPSFVDELERDQLVREAISSLPPRCQEMIRLLFFTFPAKPYQEVAAQLGLATGSIGFIRGRCLERLKKALLKLGL